MSVLGEGSDRLPAAERQGGWAKPLQYGWITAPLIGVLWTFTMATTVAVAVSFLSGGGFRPSALACLILGAALGLAALRLPLAALVGAAVFLTGIGMWAGLGPILVGEAPD